ncbi:MAG: hypothetical protein U0L04_00455 [Bacteroidaceae bacterium]|nr:hypothetical protein [Bacteroidaceae bacterium]
MKLHYLFTMVTGLLGLAACQNDDVFLAEDQGTLEFFTSTEIDTRTSLQDGNKVVWNEGDAVAVYDFAATKKRFVAEINEGTTHFRGNITPKYGDFIAAYPYDLAAENDNARKIIMYLPEEQTAVKDGFGPDLNLSIAKGSRHVDGTPSEVRFRNICQLFKLSVPAYTANRIAKIELTTNTAIAGQLIADYTDYNPVITTNSQGSKTIALYPPTGSESFAEGTYYMVLAPIAVEGFTLTLTDTNGKKYTQHSSASIGGNWGVICNLGNVDLIDKPVITPKHVYDNGILVGTKVTLTAPVSDKAWSALIKNANGEIVRTLTEATGELTTDHTDDTWPYLPKGNYTLEYTYTTANGKQMNAASAFTITEEPQFTVTLDANSTYSYYLVGDVDKANSMDKNAVTGIVCQIHGILSSILTNDKYGFSLNNNFNGTIASTNENVANYNNISINQLGESELTTSVTFDGVTKVANKKVWITGLPFRHEPPTTSLWSKDGDVTNEDGYALFGKWSGGSQKLTYNDVNIPAGTKMSLAYKIRMRSEPVETVFTISANNQTIFTDRVSGTAGEKRPEGSTTFTNSGNTTQIICNNSYGAGLTFSELYLIALSYSK